MGVRTGLRYLASALLGATLCVAGCGGHQVAPSGNGATGDRAEQRRALTLARGEHPQDHSVWLALVDLDLDDARPGAALEGAAYLRSRGVELGSERGRRVGELLLRRALVRVARLDPGALADLEDARALGVEVPRDTRREAAFAVIADHYRRRGASDARPPAALERLLRDIADDDRRLAALDPDAKSTEALSEAARWLVAEGALQRARMVLEHYVRSGGRDPGLLAMRARLTAPASLNEVSVADDQFACADANLVALPDGADSGGAAIDSPVDLSYVQPTHRAAIAEFVSAHQREPVHAEAAVGAWIDGEVDGLSRGAAAAAMYLVVGDPVRALRIMERLEKTGVRAPAFVLAHAATVAATGDIARAAQHFETAVAVARDDAQAAALAARWLMWNGAYPEAQGFLRRAVALSSSDIDRRQRLLYAAAVASMLGRSAAAAGLERDALQSVPDRCAAAMRAEAARWRGDGFSTVARISASGFARLAERPVGASYR